MLYCVSALHPERQPDACEERGLRAQISTLHANHAACLLLDELTPETRSQRGSSTSTSITAHPSLPSQPSTMSPLSLSRPPHHILAPSLPTLTALSTALHSLNLSTKPSSSTTITSASTRTSLFTPQKRHASHQAQGRANGARDGPGKRLGAKKTAGQYVVPGNILYRQRGTLWFPGEGCSMVSPHTQILALPRL